MFYSCFKLPQIYLIVNNFMRFYNCNMNFYDLIIFVNNNVSLYFSIPNYLNMSFRYLKEG